jgi:hypothetical protein
MRVLLCNEGDAERGQLLGGRHTPQSQVIQFEIYSVRSRMQIWQLDATQLSLAKRSPCSCCCHLATRWNCTRSPEKGFYMRSDRRGM